jgi:glycerol-3-phosphate dehydrogenase
MPDAEDNGTSIRLLQILHGGFRFQRAGLQAEVILERSILSSPLRHAANSFGIRFSLCKKLGIAANAVAAMCLREIVGAICMPNNSGRRVSRCNFGVAGRNC